MANSSYVPWTLPPYLHNELEIDASALLVNYWLLAFAIILNSCKQESFSFYYLHTSKSIMVLYKI